MRNILSLVLSFDDPTSSDSSSSSSGDETDLLSWGCISSDSGSLSNVLMVSSSVRMFNWIHGYSSHDWPTVSLSLVLMVGSSCFQNRLVDSSSSSNNANHRSVDWTHDLLGSWRKLHSSLLCVRIVSNYSTVISRSSGQFSSISALLFDVANDSSFRHGSDWKYIPDLKSSLSTTVNKLSRVHALSSQEELLS